MTATWPTSRPRCSAPALPVALVDVAVVLIAAWDVAGFAAELEPPHAALDEATAASATPAMSPRRL